MDAGQHANSGKPGIIRRFFSFLVIIAIVLICSYGIRTYVIEPFEVPSGSMEDTIMTGDMVFAEKVSYLAGIPKVHRRSSRQPNFPRLRVHHQDGELLHQLSP